jgi:hypothetical protein
VAYAEQLDVALRSINKFYKSHVFWESRIREARKFEAVKARLGRDTFGVVAGLGGRSRL